MTKNLAVKTVNLTKTFSGKEIIKNCDMSVTKGTIYGFLGVNGAGKTTLFKLLMGLLTKTAGRLEIFGKNIETKQMEILQDIGCMIEVPVFYEHLSATENLQIHLEYMNKEQTNIEETLEAVGLFQTGKAPVANFSLGMKQRLGIARAIIHKPQLLILDEPINGLDPIGIRQIRELFLKLVKDQEMTILLSSHLLSEVEQIADIIGVIVNGTIVEEVDMHLIKNHSSLEDYFFQIMRGEQVHANVTEA